MGRRAVLALFGAAAALHLACLRDEWFRSWDSGVYLSLARSIVAGDGYAYAGLPHFKYPPGFPLLCAPVEALAGNDFRLLRLLVTAFAVASVLLAHRVVAVYASPSLALPAAALFAASYAVVGLVPAILSDLPFAAFALGSLLALRRFRDRGRWGDGAVLAGLLLAAFFTRIAGAAFALAAALSLGRARLRGEGPPWGRIVATGALVALPAFAWMARTASLRADASEGLRDTSSYEREFASDETVAEGVEATGTARLGERLGRNAAYYRSVLAELASGGLLRLGYPPSEGPLATALALLVVAAVLRAAWIRRSAAEAAVVATLLLYLFWPARQGARFLVPILPLLLAYAFDGAVSLGTRVFPAASSPRRVLLPVLTLLLLAANAPRVVETIRLERREPYHPAGTRALFAAAGWLREHAPRDAFVVSGDSSAVTMLSGARGRAFPVTRSGDALAAFLRGLAASGAPVYLVVAPAGDFGPTHFWPALAEAREKGLVGGEVVHTANAADAGGAEASAVVWRLRF